jgi:cell division FtsZ-interacting protein ZapD
MIKRITSVLICRIRSHNLIPGGSCPFTGKTYQYCKRCTTMIPIEGEEID